MRLKTLPRTARLAAGPESVFRQFQETFELADAQVVEIGGCLPTRWIEGAGIAAWTSIDPRNEADRHDGPVRTCVTVGSDIPHEEGWADLAFSCNAFQHVHDVEATFEEIARVLRPGGHLYANFGPVWSAPDGSHIEDLEWQGRKLQFWEQTLLPSWSHLVFSEPELTTLLAPVHGPDLARHVSEYVHHSSWINRRLFNDYRRAAADSPLEIVWWQGNGSFDYPYDPPSVPEDPAIPASWRERLDPDQLPREVRERHGHDGQQLAFRDIEFLLRRPLP